MSSWAPGQQRALCRLKASVDEWDWLQSQAGVPYLARTDFWMGVVVTVVRSVCKIRKHI